MKILLIRLRLIGDVVFTTPAIGAIKRHLPHARLAYLVEPLAAPVVTSNPHLDRVIVARRNRGLARVREDVAIVRQLRRARFDVAIDFHGGPRAAWFTRASGAPVRLGYDLPGRGWTYTERVPRAPDLRPRHSVENQWDLLRPLGAAFATPPDPSIDRVDMPVETAAARSIERRLTGAGITAANAVIVVHVSAGNPFRRWPTESFVDLAVALLRARPARRLIITAGPSDASAAGQVRSRARAALRAGDGQITWDGIEFTLPELRALIGRSALFIGGDSGPLHIAATTRTPVVGLYGPTLAERSAPWRDPACVTESVYVEGLPCRPCEQRHCVPGDFRCLTAMTADAVARVAERALTRAAELNNTNHRPRTPAAPPVPAS
ncbi:MAG: glycosyltransferase family 9 protein [Acidobacteria bacterium]|nr:glycosyltransferase family 9 protein [Acidobacteriota bacterium]